MTHLMRLGFTLIELLVVITIIVVLLSLLAPAMDGAIYQAELAVCGTRMKGVGAGAHQYAFDHHRRYPRHVTDMGGQTMFLLASEFPNQNPELDMRPIIQGYIDLKMLVDPLAGDIDFSEDEALDSGNEFVWMAYGLWFGWGYKDEGGGMKKIGDRVTLNSQGLRLNILAGDLDLVHESALVSTAHPDKDGVTHLVENQDADRRGGGAADDLVLTGLNLRLTYSWWQAGTHERGPVDLNFLYGDGAVTRLNDVAWDEPDTTGRVAKLPWLPNNPTSGYPQRRLHLPSH